MIPLIGILISVVGGHAIAAVLAGVTIAQWVEVASFLLKLAPLEIQILRRLHPAFAELHNRLIQGHSPQHAAYAAHQIILKGH